MILSCVTLTQRCSRTKEAFIERGHYFNMVRNYKRKTDREYNWTVKRERTWDAKKEKQVHWKRRRHEPEYEAFIYATPEQVAREEQEDEHWLEEHCYDDLARLDVVKQCLFDVVEKVALEIIN